MNRGWGACMLTLIQVCRRFIVRIKEQEGSGRSVE
jgi:hypothetical protein